MSSAPPSPQRLAFAGMLAMTAGMGIGRFVYTPILPGMMEALDQSASEVGFIAGFNYVGYLLGAILAGGGWAHGWERPVALASIALSAALCFAMAASDSFAAFAAIRFAAGLTSAFVMIFNTSIVFAALARHGRSDLQWLHFGGVGIGIAFSAVMVAGFAATTLGWRADWVAAGIVSLLILLAVSLLLRDVGAGNAASSREPPLVMSPALRRIILAYGIFGFGYVVTATFLIAIMRAQGANPFAESLVWLATGLAIFPSVYLWGFVARRMGLRRAYAVGCLVEAIGVMVAVTMGGIIGPMIGGILLGATFIAITALGFRIGNELAADAPRRAIAVLTTAFGLGQIAGPPIAGYLADLTGDYFWPSAVAALALLLSAGLALSSRLAESRPLGRSS